MTRFVRLFHVVVSTLIVATLLSTGPTPQTVPENLTLRTENVVAGSGILAKEGDRVTIHFRAAIPGGRVLADSRKRGLPYTFTIGSSEAITALDRGVLGMAAKGVRVIEAPAGMAYGSSGAFPIVPINSALRFRVEVIQVVSGSRTNQG